MTCEAPTISNSKQRDEWNGESGRRWLDRHETIDKQIAPFGHRAMDAAAIGPGQHILDIGCGCGETSFDLARRVGETGLVLGVDISTLLIEAAQRAVQQSSISNVRFEEADAQTYPFQRGSFDLAFSRFGIMFFEDPDFAFRNIHAALRPGGVLAFVAWLAPAENLFLSIPIGAAARYITLPAPAAPNAPGPFAFADIERVRGMLSRASFTGIKVDRVIEKVGGGSLDETTELLLQLGPLAGLLNTLDDQTRCPG